jgi:RNA polymerase sigma factor (sigma-70 family)
MSNEQAMPHGLPEDPAEFRSRMEATKDALRRSLGPATPATSAVSDALVRSLEELRLGRTPTGFWVRVTRRAIDLLRRKARHGRALAEVARDEERESLDPAAEAASRELYARLTDANGLTDAEREVWLPFCDGKSDVEIAAALNKRVETVRVALSRARKHVAERLEEMRRREG